MPKTEELLVNLWAFLLVSAGATVLAVVAYTRWRRAPQKFLLLPRLRPVYWTGREVTLAFLIYVTAPLAVYSVLSAAGVFQFIYGERPAHVPESIWTMRQYLWTSLAAPPLALALILSLLWSLTQTRPAELGLHAGRLPQHYLLGYLGHLGLTPLTLGLFFLVLLWFRRTPHAFESLSKEISLPVEWCLLIFQAVVTAPVLEETLFRGLLQNWLRRASLAGHGVIMAMILTLALAPILIERLEEEKPAAQEKQANPAVKDGTDVGGWGSPAFGLTLVIGYGAILGRIWWRFYRPRLATYEGSLPRQASPEAAAEAIAGAPAPPLWLSFPPSWEEKKARAWLALYGSAALFAVFHSAWPTPIPLFFLALGLGWLAQRAGSVVPSIVAHALFNAVACAELLIGRM